MYTVEQDASSTRYTIPHTLPTVDGVSVRTPVHAYATTSTAGLCVRIMHGDVPSVITNTPHANTGCTLIRGVC